MWRRVINIVIVAVNDDDIGYGAGIRCRLEGGECIEWRLGKDFGTSRFSGRGGIAVDNAGGGRALLGLGGPGARSCKSYQPVDINWEVSIASSSLERTFLARRV